MSQENVEIVRRWFEVLIDDDWTGFEALHDPHVVVLPPDDWPDGEVSIGRDAWIRQMIRLRESWKTDTAEVDEVHDAGGHVLAGMRWIAVGDSGIEFEIRLWAVLTLSRRSVTRIEWFRDRLQALEAAGVAE